MEINKKKKELSEIAELQMTYDKAVFDKFESEWNACKCHLALIDEIGEVNHELKKLWCYWKESQSKVDRKKLLEELSDCLHFAMSYYINESLPYSVLNYAHTADTLEDWVDNLAHAIVMEIEPNSYLSGFSLEKYRNEVEHIISFRSAVDLPLGVFAIAKLCGFSFDELIKAYKEKNKINWERLENGY